jgi:hypothetical protein
MRPQRIDHLGLLPQQKIACSMLHQPALLLGRLRSHKSHRRPANRLTYRRCVADHISAAPERGKEVNIRIRIVANQADEPSPQHYVLQTGDGFGNSFSLRNVH